jgi:hypothetical protein
MPWKASSVDPQTRQRSVGCEEARTRAVLRELIRYCNAVPSRGPASKG